MNSLTSFRIKTQSVRFRLALWYSLAFFVTITIVFAIFYSLTSQILFRQTDQDLSSHGQKILEVLNREETGMHTMLEKQAFIRDFSEIPGMVVIIMDTSGKIINSSITTTSDNKTLTGLFRRAEVLNKPSYIDETFADSSMRFWISAVKTNQGEFSGVVMMAHPVDVIKNSLEELFLVLMAVLLLSVIPAVFGGYFLAKRALQPISNISTELKRIGSENLDERVNSPKTGDELEELSVTFNSLLDRLAASFTRERQFIADVAHELKTPLSTLRSSMEIALTKQRSSEEYKKTIADAMVDINSLSTTLKNVLDLAWSDADNSLMNKEIVNLSEEVTELCDIATKMALAKKITINGEVEKNVLVLGKRDKLGRAVLNIIDNAIKYTTQKEKVTINLKTYNDQAIVEVKDAGVGIVPEDLPHIFERFYRGNKTDKTFGSGLGLAITRAVITAHHGSINVRSKTGKGSTFIVKLPLVKAIHNQSS